MELNEAVGQALRDARKAQGLTQESFSDVSSRTYLSILERGLKSPTLEKVDELAGRLGIHPLSLLFRAYLVKDQNQDFEQLLALVAAQVQPYLRAEE